MSQDTITHIAAELSEPKYDPAIYGTMFRLWEEFDGPARVAAIIARTEGTE